MSGFVASLLQEKFVAFKTIASTLFIICISYNSETSLRWYMMSSFLPSLIQKKRKGEKSVMFGIRCVYTLFFMSNINETSNSLHSLDVMMWVQFNFLTCANTRRAIIHLDLIRVCCHIIEMFVYLLLIVVHINHSFPLSYLRIIPSTWRLRSFVHTQKWSMSNFH